MTNKVSSAPRKHYLDNLRAFTILFLFPYHIFVIYSWGAHWYIRGENLWIPTISNEIANFWMMPLLFAIAGISSRYALEKRNAGEYAKERVCKLLLPLLFGLLLVIPIQPYLAAMFLNGEASYFNSFTKLTDLTGYDGAFTPAHLWFILVLFVISMACLPFMIWYKNKGKGTLGDNVPLILVILLGLLPCIVKNNIFEVIEIDGKSILEYSVYFLLGYFFLSNDSLLKKLEKYRFLLLGLSVSYAVVMTFVLNGEFYELASWLSVLMILGMGRRYLNFTGKITGYLAKSSFGIYIFHQSWIVVTAFLILQFTDTAIFQILLIFPSSIILTYATYEICRRVPVLRSMFGLKGGRMKE